MLSIVRNISLSSLLLASSALLTVGCSGDGGPGDGGSGDGDSGDGDSGDGDSNSDEGATVTVDGTTYEITEVLDCTIGNEGYPDDRKFIGESADGSVQFSVFYLDLGGETVPDVGLDTEVDGSEWTWSSLYAGSEGDYEITVLDDGAEGSSEVRVVGIDAPDANFTMTWSFSCEDR